MNKYFVLLTLLAGTALAGIGCTTSSYTKESSSSFLVGEPQIQTVTEAQKLPLKDRANNSTGVFENNGFYVGQYFDIMYPKEFEAIPKSPVINKVVQTSEATFTSPDGEVEFFVFAPLWSGDPNNYLAIKNNEEMVSEKTEESGLPTVNYDRRIVKWTTVKEKSGLYYRSFISIKEHGDPDSELHHVFGIKYKDNEAYEKYKNEYANFKNSLRQYAD